jgi:hypothetical protein
MKEFGVLCHVTCLPAKTGLGDFGKSAYEFLDFLNSKKLYDSKIWEYQARALIDPEEMVEVKHRLIKRRQKIRDQINHNTESVKLERDEIDRIMQEHNFFVPEILEIIHSVDKLCGLNQYKR